MKRYRWLNAQWPISIRVLAKRLGTKSFSGDQIEGFVLDRVRDGFLDARFVEKIEYDDTVTDPFGTEAVFHRVEFRSCEFKATLDSPGLELIDPPRSIQTMISRLAEVTDFGLAVSSLSVNVLDWASGVQRRMNEPGIVDSMQLGAVELTANIQAKAVIKGNVDVLEATRDLVRGKRYVIEKIQIRFARPQRMTVLLTNNGVARFDQEPSHDLLNIVRASLPL